MRSCYNCPIFKDDKLSVRNCPLTVFDAVDSGFTPGEDCLYKGVKVDGELELTPEQLDNAFKSAQEGMKSCVEWRDPISKANEAPALAVGGEVNGYKAEDMLLEWEVPNWDFRKDGYDNTPKVYRVYRWDDSSSGIIVYGLFGKDRWEPNPCCRKLVVHLQQKAQRLEEATRWRSMDSAPVDGRHELPLGIRQHGQFQNDWVIAHYVEWRDSGWLDQFNRQIIEYADILCWRPRPQPPSEKELEGLE